MSNSWIVDMRHYLDDQTDDLPESLPGPAVNVALFFGSIVAWVWISASTSFPGGLPLSLGVILTSASCGEAPSHSARKGGAGFTPWGRLRAVTHVLPRDRKPRRQGNEPIEFLRRFGAGDPT